jgi:hypothetical protein
MHRLLQCIDYIRRSETFPVDIPLDSSARHHVPVPNGNYSLNVY